MTRPSNRPAATTLAIAALALLAILVPGCARGPMDPGRQALVERREAWLTALKEAAVADEVFYLGDKGEFEPVTVKAVPLTGPLLSKLSEIFPGDRRLSARLAKWTGKGRAVVLVGWYARHLKSGADFLKDPPTTAKLALPGVAPVAPDAAYLVDAAFLADYFPVFTRWDRVVAYAYRTSLGPGSVLSTTWPSGGRDLPLWPSPTSEAR